MMRHWVNFGLLFSFLALTVTGVMAYVLPFSIHTARVHIVFGAATVLLVVLHLVSRMRYFAHQLAGKHPSRGMVSLVFLVCGVLLYLAISNHWPAKPVMDGSYEARRRAEIVRSSPMAGFLDMDAAHRFVARRPGAGADTAVSLMVRFRDGLEKPPAMAVWAETDTGTMIETLYLDESLAYGENVEWQGHKSKRLEWLPIWRHKHTVVSGVDPHGKVDAYTAATPEHSFTLDQKLKTGDSNGFVLCVEVNAAGDANAAFPDKVLGQPSLLYTAYVEPKESGEYVLLELTAHGGGAFEHGTPEYDFEGVDTAKKLVDLLLVKTGRMDRGEKATDREQ